MDETDEVDGMQMKEGVMDKMVGGYVDQAEGMDVALADESGQNPSQLSKVAGTSLQSTTKCKLTLNMMSY